MLYLSAEHLFICVSAFLFPPVFFFVASAIVLASFGKSFGFRKKYVSFLIKIFEWGAGQVKTTAELQRKESRRRLHYENGDLDADDAEEPRNSERDECIIHHEATIHREPDDGVEKKVDCRGWAIIRDSTDFLKAGIEAIIEDEVTSRFEAEQLATWNMLTRTSVSFYHSVNWKLTLLWAGGFIVRYAVLLPLRLTLFAMGFLFVVVCTAIIGVLPEGEMKKRLNEHCMLACHRILSRSFTAIVHFYNPENKAKSGGICVANHTSPIDVLMLGTDNVYALIGQRHTGFLGFTQRALSRSSSHIWFDRSEAKDRALVAARLQEHVNDPSKLPILIFPEGTCINNTSVMMFKKGCFEAGTTIYPIAMKYDSLFGDAFWNSSEQGWCEYLLRMMTSWAIICNVWYLPPMTKLPKESGADFANRVKREIAIRGGLVDLEWDGGLKRTKVPMKMVADQQQKYYNRISRYTSCSDTSGKPHLKLEGKLSSEISGTPSALLELDDLDENVVIDEEPFEDGPSIGESEMNNDRDIRETVTQHDLTFESAIGSDSDEAFEDSQEDTGSTALDVNLNKPTSASGSDADVSEDSSFYCCSYSQQKNPTGLQLDIA